MDAIEIIRQIPNLVDVPAQQIAWMIEKGEFQQYKKGDYIFKGGDPIESMIVILKGAFSFKIKQGGSYRITGSIEAPAITGTLPFSRTKNAAGLGEAIEDVEIFKLHKSHFKDLVGECYELSEGLVHIMSSRIRDFTKQQQQSDKMVSLGKLSAGLAHELNNPSSAVVRGAQTLSKHLKALPNKFKSVMKIETTDEVVDEVNEVLFNRIASGIQKYSLIEKSEREDDILDWLEDNEIEEADEIAENFVDFGFEEDDLENIQEKVRQEDLKPILMWLNQVLTTERLVDEIEDASQRIHDLVSSIKSYTHMDQAPSKKATNVHIGIENTLIMLNHKLKKNNIQVVKDFEEEMDHPQILISEMNQVWTNLIDNAIDAMEGQENRELRIRTYQRSGFINIHIQDSGSGISKDVIEHIFDPFYTTKEIGKGTGIGLEIVHRIITRQHKGRIDVDSEPGKTVFKVCIPMES